MASEREFTLREVSDGVRVTLPAGRAMVLEVRQVKPAPAARRLADLGISRADIRYDERGHLLVDLHNLGSLPADDVEVAFYDGDPRLGAPLLGRRTVSHIEPPDRLVPQIVRVGIEWRPSRERHEITVVVDPDETIEEISERNNTAGRHVIALPESK